MCVRKSNARRIAVATMLVLNFAASYSGQAATAEIPFAGHGYSISGGDLSKLSPLLEEAKADSKILIVISERSEGLQRGTMAYIVERVRALRIFQVFARAGIDPARINFEVVAPETSTLKVETVRSETVHQTTMLVPNPNASDVSELVINFS